MFNLTNRSPGFCYQPMPVFLSEINVKLQIPCVLHSSEHDRIYLTLARTMGFLSINGNRLPCIVT